jgi:hypothetical protein
MSISRMSRGDDQRPSCSANTEFPGVDHPLELMGQPRFVTLIFAAEAIAGIIALPEVSCRTTDDPTETKGF